MKRIYTIILGMLCLAVAVKAESVSQKQAQQLAQLFFNQSAGNVTAPPKLVYNGKKLTTGRFFTPFYVYNTSLGGFVIISAENKAFPILGFSLKDSFDPEKLGDSEMALLKSYAMEIELVRYDTQPVDGAVWAWQHYGDYVDGILKAKYTATDPKFSVEESLRLIDHGIETDDAVYSDMYTPRQWRDMIEEELNLKESAPLGLVSANQVYPAVVYGRQGDYFRIEMSRRNSWLMRLNATEVIPSSMITLVVNPLMLPDVFEEELPFETLDLFLAEVKESEKERTSLSSIDKPMIGTEPFVKANGAGHFEIVLPEEVKMVRIYNLAGSMVKRNTYTGTNIANVDISEQPSGFYFVTLSGESGQTYGQKLFR